MSTACENWKLVPSLPDYEASDLGRVRRATRGKGTRIGKILSASPDSVGYPTIGTTGGPKRVHVLVAEAFLGPIPKGGQVHHQNEDRLDARASNLEIKPSRLAHAESHRKHQSEFERRRHGEPNPDILCVCGCGRMFPKFDRFGRPRRFVSGHNVGRNTLGQFALREGR